MSDEDFSTIRTYRNEADDRLLHIDLDRPEENNVVNTELLRELGDAIRAGDAHEGVDAIILGTSGENFCAGGSLQELGSIDRDAGNRFLTAYIDTVELLRETGKPTVAAVKGTCVAGGNEIVMGADIIVGGESARFGQPEAAVGRVVPDDEVDERATEIAQTIIDENSPQAYRVIKAMLKQWSNVAMVNREVARELTANVWGSEEFRDRANSFMDGEKLEPRSFPGTLADEE